MRESDERKGALLSFVAAFLAIIVGGTGRDAELLRRSRRQRAVAGAFAGVMELLRAERTLQGMFGLDAANRKGICPWSRRHRSVRNRFWACRAPTSGRGDGPLWAAAAAAAALKPSRLARRW